MWSLLPRNFQVVIILVSGSLIAWAYDALSALLLGESPSTWQSISFAVTVVGTILVVLADWLWPRLWRQFPLLQKIIFPDLNGVWKGEMISTWVDPETGQPKPPIPTTITIRQSLFSTNVLLRTGESKSHSTRSFLERSPGTDSFKIWYTYNSFVIAARPTKG
jgi:hypothetical protein